MFRQVSTLLLSLGLTTFAQAQCPPDSWGTVGGGVNGVGGVNSSFGVACVGSRVEVVRLPAGGTASRVASYETHRPLKSIKSIGGIGAWTTDGESILWFDNLNAAVNPLQFRGSYNPIGGVRDFIMYYPYALSWTGQALTVSSYASAPPQHAATLVLPQVPLEGTVLNNRLYLATASRQIMVIDLTNPEAPAYVTTLNSGAANPIGKLHASSGGGLRVFLAMSDGGTFIRVLDLYNDSIFGLTGITPVPGGIVQIGNSVVVTQGTVYRADWTNPVAPSLTPILTDDSGSFRGAALVNNRAIIADSEKGLQTIDIFTQGDRLSYQSSPGDVTDCAVLEGSGYLFAADGGNGLRTVNLTDSPAGRSLDYIGGTTTSGFPTRVALGSSVLMASDGFTVKTYNTNIPDSPSLRGTYTVNNSTFADVAASGGAGLIARNSGITGGVTLDLVDLRFATPLFRDSRPIPQTPVNIFRRIRAFGDLAFTIASREVRIYSFNAINPQSLTSRGVINIGTDLQDVAIDGTTAYLHDYAGAIHVFNLSNPDMPTWTGSVSAPEQCYSMALSGNWLVTAGRNLNFFSIHDRSSPVPMASTPLLSIPGNVVGVPGETGPNFVTAGGQYGMQAYAPPSQFKPVIVSKPQTVRTCPGGTVTFSVEAVSPDPATTYQWWRNDFMSQPQPIAGATSSMLTLSNVTSADAGFDYYCEITNFCGRATTEAVGLTICRADVNCSGSVSVQDVFDYLSFYFGGDPRADLNGQGGVTLQDLFDFLAAYFGGCATV